MRRCCRISVLLLLLFYPGSVWAGHITIEGNPQLRFLLEDSMVKVQGSYDAQNRGNDTAQRLRPVLELGSWRWQGDARTVEPGKNAVWQLEESFSVDDLDCARNRSCAGLPLPQRGHFPLLVRHLYEATDGQGFMAVNAFVVEIGSLSGEEKAAVRMSGVQARIRLEERSRGVKGGLTLLNQGLNTADVAVSYLSSEECRIATSPRVISLPPGGEAEAGFEGSQDDASAGSVYSLFAVLQWAEDGVRNSMIVPGVVNIEKQGASAAYVILLLIAVVLPPLILYGFVIRQVK